MQKGFDYIGTSVITMCHDGNGKYLLSLRDKDVRDEKGNWEPAGGGGVEFGESSAEALVREVQEEIGATPFNLEFMGMREIFREHAGRKTHWVAFDYRAQVNPEEVKIMEPHKCDELRWCTVEEIPEPMHSQFPSFLEKYKHIL